MSVTICQATPGKLFRKKTEVKSLSDLKAEAAVLCNLKVETFRLVFQGVVLDDKFDVTKLTNNIVMVVPLPPAKPHPTTVDPVNLSEDDYQKFRLAFKSALKNSAFTRVSKRLLQRENMENLAAACPGLQEDPIAQAFLTKPNLLIHLLDQDTLKLVAQKHPALLEAAHNLAAAVHEEVARGNTLSGSKSEIERDTDSSATYFLDEMSDEEMEEEWQGAADTGAGPSGVQRSAITAEQLAAALAATGNPFMGGVTGMGPGLGDQLGGTASVGGSGQSSAAATTPGGARITADMFQAAMQQALLGIPPPNSSGVEGMSAGSGSVPPLVPDWSSQLTTMRDMGIIDEGLARQALTMTAGDLQAAIELIFSGSLGNFN